MSAQIMSLFGSLSSSNIDERVSAATSIVHHLTQAESARHDVDSESNDCSNSPDLNYTLKRLVRGLASPTPGARLGFSNALCEIINRFPGLSPLSIFELILSATPLQSNMKASEERDSQFGRLFGIKCITQSGALLRKLDTPQGIRKSTNVNEQSTLLKLLLEELCALARRAPWLSESVGSVIVLDITTQILEHPESSLSQSGAVNQIAEMLLKNAETLTLEQISLAILLQQHSVKLDWPSILSQTFTNKQILSEDNHEKLFTILMNADGISSSHSGASEVDTKTSSHNTDLPICPHFVHEILISASQSASKFNLSNFYNQLFERYYFASKSSPSRRSHGFLILNKLLASKFIPDQEKPNFLTLNCVHTLKVHLTATDRLLHKMAQSVASTMISQVDTKNAKGSALAKSFATRIRALSPHFDHNTHHQLIRSLVSRMLSPELELWTEELISAFQKGSPTWSCLQLDSSSEAHESQSPPESFREMMLTQLCNVININTSASTIDCATSILRCLTLCAFFGEVASDQNGKSSVRSAAPAVHFSPQLRELCKARLYTCLLELIDRTKTHSSDRKTHPKTSSLHGFKPSEVIIEIVNSHGSSQPHEGLETSECIKSIRKKLTQLRSRAASTESPKLQSKKEALVLLCDILCLMTYDEQDGWTEALPLIERLRKDINTLLPPDGDFAHHLQALSPAVANLTGCLLFLLSWPIALLRLVVEINFDSFSDCVGAQSLQLLIDQINPPEELPEVEDNEDDEASDSQAEEDDDSTAGDSSGLEDSDSGAESADDSESVDEQFRNDVAMALGHALSKPAASDDDSGDESDLMNDDEMLALDANLAAIFKRRTGKKLARIHNTQDLHLRMKILELIGKFVKLHPAPATRARLIKPLLELIGKTNSSEAVMKKKVIKILEDTTRLSCNQSERSIPGEPLLAAEASEIIAAVHLVARTSPAVDTAESCAKCNLWLIEMIHSSTSSFVLESERQEVLNKLVEAHEEGLRNFCSKRSSKLRPTFFSAVFKRFPAFSWLLRDVALLMPLDSSTVNAYRREQVLDLVSMLINRYPKSPSLLDFDAYVCKLKEAILSLKEVIVTSNSEEEISKDRQVALKSLCDLIKIMNSALRKRLKIGSSETDSSTIWSDTDIKALSELAAEIPSAPQSSTVIKLIEGLVQFVEKSKSSQVKLPDQPKGLKRKEAPSTAPATEAQPLTKEAETTELSAPVTNGKQRKKSKKNRKKEATNE
ncbi:hypothetical protein PTTG_03225 [Puccinia triticina 1-1 BBBD Race 1]|uniref:DNA polymerase phi subunit n=2 Tax=Puccinia triticina TaxID=208348 RepID=A0A180GT41_PUCT1|nr:uncharacterized protein PtA15_10A248 [Puccinia triticina]OAV95976.1 hypothetical protein PTTG_03225 [Puccinia triticina 1-1 BBBD Race 1]WAQ88828.1 hypothetical protein PtA15_10A248 [Puccinia triticina]WAR58886.1 hypothetical protein PtB15_10B225 [Puccinia triticina]